MNFTHSVYILDKIVQKPSEMKVYGQILMNYWSILAGVYQIVWVFHPFLRQEVDYE